MDLPPFELEGPADAPVIVALGGISSSHHVRASEIDPSQGWWESATGQGCPLPRSGFRVLGMGFVDAGAREDGRPDGIVATHDQADALAAVLDVQGISRVHAVIGASYGGMVALAFAERYPERLERLIVIGAAHRTHAMTMGIKALQRRIIELGLETGRERDGVILARALAMTTFRSAKEFDKRFTRSQSVEAYLLYHGQTFAKRFTPARFLALSLSGCLHRVDPAKITTPTTLVAAEGDTNVPREVVEELARSVAGPCRVADLPSENGHDAFLTEPEALGRILREALS
ncbi:MAG: alpha/beta fold hydrolase [Gemmatimonadaceae bacterium]